MNVPNKIFIRSKAFLKSHYTFYDNINISHMNFTSPDI